jgi:glycosyltransferase involved in cell wall biosynthesis
LENAVDTERFYPPALHTKGEVVRILGVGSIKPVKRHDVFLKALAEVKRAAPALAWQALLVGEGPLRGDMEVLAADLKLGNRVIFAGAQDDMPPVYRQADILVHTSDFEGMPNVILEAMACGLPVVATRVGATPDLVVTGKTGYLASPGDVSSLADKILCLAQQPDLRRQMGRAARKRVVDTYSLSALQENLLSLYTNLLQEYRTGVVEGLSS